MTLQVFNSAGGNDEVSFPSGDRHSTARQLLADCVAEIQRVRDSAKPASSGDQSPLASAMAMLDQLRYQMNFKISLRDYETGVAILNAAPDQQVELVLLAMSTVIQDQHSDPVTDRLCHELLKSLLRRKLACDATAISQMLTMVEADATVVAALPVMSILTNVQRHIEQHGLSEKIRKQLNKLLKIWSPEGYTAEDRKRGIRIRELLDLASTEPAVKLHSATPTKNRSEPPPARPFNVRTGEAWTNALLEELGKLSVDAQNNWHQLLAHCGTAKSSSPSQKWLKQSAQILERIGQVELIQVLAPALAAIGQPGASQRRNYGGHIVFGEPTLIHDTHADLLRGLVWSTSLCDDPTLIGIVGDAAEKCFQKIREVGPRSPKVGNACLVALSRLASESAIAQLGRLQSRTKHASTRKQIGRAFERAAAKAGISEADLVELSVPKFGMNNPGPCRETIGQFTAEFTVHANRKPELVWMQASGKRQKTVPAALKSEHAAELSALKKKLKDIDTLMPSVRHRVEQLFLGDRSWPLADFRSRFLDHPLVGVVARRLVWNLHTGETGTPGFWHEDQFVDAGGRAVEVSNEQTRVTIWHPMQSDSTAVLQWRQWLETHQISQPFKQAHREVYILTDAERETAVYSNRFASHIVRQHQLAALCHRRGWRYELQGDWDSWNAPFIDLPRHGMRVEFLVHPLDGLNDVTESFIYTHLSTDQVRFLPLNTSDLTPQEQPVPLASIPPLVFSEVMRDVDLFVGVTSVGNDPNWRLGGEGACTNYWQKFSFGALSETAITRKQTLERIVPRLKIARQCRFDGNFLTVQGKLRTYRIHLGSGNVLMSPDDRFLCIVQKRGSGTRRTDNIYLPFEGDHTLSLILSKAFLLVDDDQIKDPTIVNQIRLDR